MALNNQSPIQTALKFLQTNQSAAIGTVSSLGRPHVATVYYLNDKKLNIYFVTSIESRKFKNIKFNPCVALAISQDLPWVKRTLHMTGMAYRIESLDQEQKIIKQLWLKVGRKTTLPFLLIYDRGYSEELALFKVVPIEMTMAKFSSRNNDKNEALFTSVIVLADH